MSPTHQVAGRPRFKRRRWLCASAALVLAAAVAAVSAGARAQDHFSAEELDPAPAIESSVLSVYSARPLPQGAYSVGLLGSYARRPLSLRDSASGERVGDLIGSVETLSLLGTIGIVDRLDLGLAVPIHRISAGSSSDAQPVELQDAVVGSSEAAFGDIRLVPRVALLERKQESGVGLAFLASVWLPTGADDLYVGESLRLEPRLVLDFAHDGFLLSGNVGYMVREQVQLLGSTIDDMVRWGVGAEIPLVAKLSVLLETFGALNVMAADFADRDAPTEALLGARFRHSGWTAQFAGGAGVVAGIGAPEWRLLLAVGYAHQPDEAEPDRDRDGLPDTSDRCPDEPEDFDGFDDTDGCPDPDNDQDGVLDAADRCPLQAEDLDGFEDTDGCPDPDNDQDGVLDTADRCPLEPGSAEYQGCLPPPPVPAPAPAPAPPPPTRAAIKDDRIEITESFLFALNRAELDLASQPLVDDIASLLVTHPEIELVVVEGHTDSTGSANHNRKLSHRRAETVVRALVASGVAQERLRSEGFGPDRPLVPNTDNDSRAQNRRVELRIERRAH
jgi:outer membrane protein OmpA-like peptidoglycan-associated protein